MICLIAFMLGLLAGVVAAFLIAFVAVLDE